MLKTVCNLIPVCRGSPKDTVHKLKGLSLLRKKKRKMVHMTPQYLQHAENHHTCAVSTEADCSSPCISAGPEGTYLPFIIFSQEQST